MIPDREKFARTMLDLFSQSEQMRQAHLALLASDLSSMRANWVYVYNGLIHEGKIDPIEKLPKKNKLELWNHAKEIAPNLDIEKSKDLCRALITIEYFLNQPV